MRKTSPFRGPDGAPLPGSIADAGYVSLGGIDQWVMIRGRSLSNPVLVILHGGPGLSDTAFFRRCNAALEESFTVVYWDQRGTGRSFRRSIPRSSMTVEQFMVDLAELVEIVCARLAKKTVVILGHSWGSALGVLYAERFPERVSAYVGCGQYGDWPAADAASYAIALEEARSQNNRRAVKALTSLGPPPYTASRLLKERAWLQRLEGQLRPKALWDMGRLILGAPESSLLDVPNIVRGLRFSLSVMWEEVSRLNLLKSAPALRTPVFFFLGCHDHWVPADTSVAYFDALKAPSKKLVWFEESGHEPFIDEPGKFNDAMVGLVRPAAVERSEQA